MRLNDDDDDDDDDDADDDDDCGMLWQRSISADLALTSQVARRLEHGVLAAAV